MANQEHRLVFKLGRRHVAVLRWDEGRLVFEGNVGRGAEAMLAHLKPMVDDYIAEKLTEGQEQADG